MKRTLLGLVAVAALAATLVSTGAFVDTVENTSEKIEMEPSDGPNAVYAVENSEGEIELDLSASNQALAGDGINEGSLTEIPNIFTVNYSTAVDDQPAEVWFTSDAGEGVKFVAGTDSVTSINGSDNKRTLDPTEKLHIGVIVDTRGDHDVESVSEFTIHVDPLGNTEASASVENDETTDGTVEETEETTEEGTDDETTEQDGVSETDEGETGQGDDADESGESGTDQDTGDTETEDESEEESEGPDTEDPDQNETSTDSGQDPGDETGGDSGEQSDDGGGLLTTGQQPTFPGPEETLGGFLSGSFLWLLVAVLGGATLFAAARYGTDRFWGEA